MVGGGKGRPGVSPPTLGGDCKVFGSSFPSPGVVVFLFCLSTRTDPKVSRGTDRRGKTPGLDDETTTRWEDPREVVGEFTV